MNTQRAAPDPRGAVIDRWLEDGRCRHEIRYPDGHVDRIAFNVYQPDESLGMLGAQGFEAGEPRVRWRRGLGAGPAFARYQFIARRP